MDYLLCITRNPKGLEAKVSRRQHAFCPPESDKPDWQNLYETVSVPLKNVKPSSAIERLCAAWQRLKAVINRDATTLTDILVVLTESVMTYDTSSLSLPILRTEPVLEPQKPTAAHPRAFHGTKYKPPKLKHPTPVNFQMALCNPKNQAIALQELWQYREKAIKPLCHLGYESARVEFLMTLSSPPTEPSLFLHYLNVPIHAKSHSFPRTFREEILPLLRGLPWYRVEATLDLFWYLELQEQVELRAIVSRFLVQSPLALDWLQHIANQPKERA